MLSFFRFYEKINEEVLNQINLQGAMTKTGIDPRIFGMAKKVMTINDFLSNPPSEANGAYALGLTKSTGDIYFQIAKNFHMLDWHKGYASAFGGNSLRAWIDLVKQPDVTNKYLNKIAQDNKLIFFFLPNEVLKTVEGQRYTREEMEYFINNPRELQKVVFVLGAYDLIDPKDYESLIAHDAGYPRDLPSQDKIMQSILKNPNAHRKY